MQCCLQILNQFKALEADLQEMQRYAAWKAADIRKALREGRAPTPGAPGDEVPAASDVAGSASGENSSCEGCLSTQDSIIPVLEHQGSPQKTILCLMS